MSYDKARNFLLILCVLFLAKNAFASSEEAFRKGNFDAAFREAYLADIVKNDPSSADLFVLGRIYFEGLGSSEKDLTKALNNFNKSIVKGNVNAALFLAEQYENGQVIEKNLVSSLQFYKKAQDLGKKNLEQKIASISSKISGGAITQKNCPEVINAANSQQENFYIMAARCLAELQGNIQTAQEFLAKKFNSSNSDDKFQIIKLLSNSDGALFSPAFALELAATLNNEDTNRDELFNVVFTEASGQITPTEFENAVNTLSTAYFNDETIFKQLTKLFEITAASRNPTISNLAINFLSTNLKDNLRQEDLFKILSGIMASETLQQEGRKKLVVFISQDTAAFFSENRNNLKKQYSYAEKYLNHRMCTPIHLAVKNESFYTAINVTKLLTQNQTCNDGNFTELITGFSGFPKATNTDSLRALKIMCSQGISNACHALGIIYKKNIRNEYSKVDAEQLAFVSFESAYNLGNADSAVELSLIAADKGQKEQALSFARFAQQNGLVEGHYAEAYGALKSLFSSSSKSCRALNTFISQASIQNRFYEEARILHKKKKCGN